MNIYVGNLPWSTTEAELRETFEEYGAVDSVSIITDRDTGRSRGFGFVEMPSAEEARAAIAGLNGREMDERALTVNEARPREEGGSRGGGSRGGGSRGGGSRGGGSRGGGSRGGGGDRGGSDRGGYSRR